MSNSYEEVYNWLQGRVRELESKQDLTQEERIELGETRRRLQGMYPPGEGPSNNYGRPSSPHSMYS